MRCPFYARVAQSVEQLAFNQWVGGSIPFTGTKREAKAEKCWKRPVVKD